jgi:hypothetical protein
VGRACKDGKVWINSCLALTEKGQIETLREHQYDAPFNSYPFYSTPELKKGIAQFNRIVSATLERAGSLTDIQVARGWPFWSYGIHTASGANTCWTLMAETGSYPHLHSQLCPSFVVRFPDCQIVE